MEISSRLSYCLSTIFDYVVLNNSSTALSSWLTLDSNNIFSRSLIVDIKSDEVEIPLIARNFYEDIIMKKIRYPYSYNVEKVILPLYNNIPDESRRTFDSIIVRMFNIPYGSRLIKVTTSKGDVYYGGKGILFDKDYTPLLLCTLTARKVHEDDEDHMVYYRPICHINPKIFLEPANIINKGIIKKVIPFFSNTEVRLPYNDTTVFNVNQDNKRVRVIIDNFDNFFIKPIKPTPSTCSNDLLNQCLVDNIDDIMMLI